MRRGLKMEDNREYEIDYKKVAMFIVAIIAVGGIGMMCLYRYNKDAALGGYLRHQISARGGIGDWIHNKHMMSEIINDMIKEGIV